MKYHSSKNHSGRPIPCELCGHMIGKGKPAKVAHEEVSNFRGEDITHWRHHKCHADAKESTK